MVVTGIRYSIKRSMDLKRSDGGVMDAITAKDMGAFPDTNLAESLQRITGFQSNASAVKGSTSRSAGSVRPLIWCC